MSVQELLKSISTGKRVLTLIGEGQARIGHVFKLISIPEECRRCRLYNACMAKLKVGRRYRVVEVRKINLPRIEKCLLTGENLIPVMVEELPILLAIPYTHNIIEGVVTTFKFVNHKCQEKLVKERGEELAQIQDGVKIKILKILGDATCDNMRYLLVLAVPLD